MSSNLYASWKEENTNIRLGYGIHNNVVVKKLDTDARKKQDGSVARVSMYICYTQVNEAKLPLGEIEEMVFWPKHDGKQGPEAAAMYYIDHLAQLLTPWYTKAQIDESLNPFGVLGITDMDALKKFVSNKKGMDDFAIATNNIFINIMSPLMGIKSDYQYRLKVTYSEDGRSTEVGRVKFIEGMHVPIEQSIISMEPRDIRAKLEAEKPKTSTNLGKAPGAGVTAMPGMPGMPMSTVPMSAVPGMPVASTPSMPASAVNPVAAQMASAPPVAAPVIASAVAAPPIVAPAPVIAPPVATAPAQGTMPFLTPAQQ